MPKQSKIQGIADIKSYDRTLYSTPTFFNTFNYPYTGIVKYNSNTGDTLQILKNDSFPTKNFMVTTGSVFLNGKIIQPMNGGDYSKHYLSGFAVVDTSFNVLKTKMLSFNLPSTISSFSSSIDNNLFLIGYLYADTTSPYLVTTGNICKIDTAGNILWQYQRFGPYANQPGGMIATPDSGLLVSLAVGPWHNFNRSVLLKLDKAGHKQWEKFLPLPQGLYDVQLKGYYPEKEEYVVFVNRTDSDKNLIVRVDSNMQPVWQLDMAEWNSQLGRLAGTVNNIKRIQGGYIGIGYNTQGIGGRKGAMLVKIDDAGKKLWQAVYDTAQSAYIKPYDDLAFSSIDTMPDGGYIVSGSTFDSTHTQVGFLMRIDSNGCLTDGNCETRYFTGVRALNEDLHGVRLYPNPTSNSVTVSLNSTETKELHYSITNLVGEIMQEGVIKEKETTLDIHNLSSGMYVVNVIGSKGDRWSGKVVKE